MPVLEKNIENRACNKIKKIWPGTQILKLNVQGQRGWPDRLICLPKGVKLLIEFKRPGGTLRKLQKVRKRDLEKLDHDVWVCETVEEALEACQTAIEEDRLNRC